ncbi:CDP-alcohol phosphatidyltransferase family protein [Candidatus Bathyarchaeota archaeon]|nr:CDP-alcohol phosphatidyltransferase family protein [Candidatus Bathyarchaeota archaeon]
MGELVSSRLKEWFQGVVKPLAQLLSDMGLKPNHLTLLGLSISMLSALCYLNLHRAVWMPLAASLLLLLSGLMDALDGVLARIRGEASPLGGFLDSLADRYSDAIVLASITVAGLCPPIYGLAALAGSLLVSYSRARAEVEGVSMAGVGIAERGERVILLSASTLLTYLKAEALPLSILLLALLTHITVIQRALHAYKALKS